MHRRAKKSGDVLETIDVAGRSEGSIQETVFLNPVGKESHKLVIQAKTAPDDPRGIVGGGIELSGGVGGENKVLHIPGDESEGTVGGPVTNGIPVVVRPIEVGTPEVEDEVIGEGIDIELLANGLINGVAGDVAVEG